jgi:tetratricopeptide (TPR) repeat protein
MSEEPAPPAPVPKQPPHPSSTRRALARDIEQLRGRRRKLFVILGALGGLGLALPLILVFRSGRAAPPPAPPPVELVKTALPKGPPATAPRTPARRMKELVELEKSTPKAFKTLYAAWTELRKVAPPELLEEVREQQERIQAAATKEYRVQWHPVHEKLRDLLGARQPREALKLLEGWKIPTELDVAGDLAKDFNSELESVRRLIDFEDLRLALLESYRKGDFSTDAVTALAPYLGASQVHVRVEAENAAGELKLIRVLGLLKQRLGSRRPAALARVEEVKKQITLDAAAEKALTSAWEARLKERTKAKPIPIRQLGVKDMDEMLRVTKYNGRSVALASDRMELTLSLDELPSEVYSRLILEAPDPAKAPELLEAGRFAVRRNALSAAKLLFDQAVKVDRSISDLVPDLGRLAAGVGTLRGQSEILGDTLSIRYDFQSLEHAKDFKISANAKIVPGTGSFVLEGERLFWSLPGDLKFSGRIRISADALAISGHAGYVVGVASEVTPGELDLLVALVQPDGGYRVIRLHRQGGQEVLSQGLLAVRSGLIEIGIDAGRAEFRVGGVTTWTGSLPEFTVLQPVVGGNGFQDSAVQVSYRSLKFEGRASPEWIRRLQSERLTIIEAELSKDRRTTRQERAAEEDSSRSFGDGLETPLPLEAELVDVIPPKVAKAYADGRAWLQKLEKAKSDQQIAHLSGQVRQCLEDAIREAPWFPLTYFYRAEWRYQEGDATGAMRDLAEASANQEGFVEARVARAELLLREGKYAEAEKEIDGSLTLVPDLAHARLTRALLHYYGGREAEAVAELELARRLEPTDVSLRRQAKRMRNIVAGPRWSGTVAIETPHYLIRAESPRLSKKGKKEDLEKAVLARTQKYAEHLTGARAYFEQLVSGPQSRSRKPFVFICDTPESYYVYADFTSEDRLEHTAGVFFNQYQQLLFYRDESEEETLQTMTHEAFHEYLHAILPSVPIWMDEGMAEYVSGVKIEGGRVASVGGILKGRLRNLQAALDSGWDGFGFDFVLWEPKEMFYTLAPELQYAQAWSMVHFLMHGKGGKYKPLLDRYVKVLLETRSTAEARTVFTGSDLGTIQREWLAYVKSLR